MHEEFFDAVAILSKKQSDYRLVVQGLTGKFLEKLMPLFVKYFISGSATIYYDIC
jgi:hypothetical protein